MSESITVFFDAWQLEAVAARFEKIAQVVTSEVEYDDPRAPETVKGLDALCDYVGLFSANAPDWSAKVLKSDTVAGVTRATVVFAGAGPDGKEMSQHGQYFVEMEGDLIARMVGFVGTGEVE